MIKYLSLWIRLFTIELLIQSAGLLVFYQLITESSYGIPILILIFVANVAASIIFLDRMGSNKYFLILTVPSTYLILLILVGTLVFK